VTPQITVLDDIPPLVATLFSEWCRTTVSHQKVARIALSGGTTPQIVYRTLAEPPYRDAIPWSSLEFYQGDERPVPPDHPDSNWGMARTSLLDRVDVSPSSLHRMIAESPDLEVAAAAYADLLAANLSHNDCGMPVFDLILLGLGADGHTASLFPGTAALHETRRFVVANIVPELQTTRLTVTLPVINAAREIWFLVTGSAKAEILRRILRERDPTLPATQVRPADGRCLWFLDHAAATHLPPTP
jgi:6-phosphogluconolactonase